MLQQQNLCHVLRFFFGARFIESCPNFRDRICHRSVFFIKSFKTKMMKRPSPSYVSTRTLIPLILILKLFFKTRGSAAFVSDLVLPRLVGSKHRHQRLQRSARKRETIAASSWSRIAEWDIPSSSFQLIDTKDAEEALIHVGKPEPYNLVSPREWLEFCEARQRERLRDNESTQEFREDSCGGAYTVLRCDYLMDQESWNIWGEDFHFRRLQESFHSLICQTELGRELHEGNNDLNAEKQIIALESSRQVMSLLLDEAKSTIKANTNQEKIEDSKSITLMLTLLWDLDHTASQDNKNPIRVQGHAFTTMQTSKLYSGETGNPNTPLQAVIGHLPATVLESHEAYKKSGSSSLPNRYQNFPQAKLSSWCRRRRLLEDIFKGDGIGDVILTLPCDDKIQTETSLSSEEAAPQGTKPNIKLLEGLTSNLFVVYPGRIIRTASSDHILGGYVRKLIVERAKNCGYTVEFGSISLEDASLWQEVFVTSSIRLIIPVEKLFLPVPKDGDSNGNFDLQTLWESKGREEEGCQSGPTASDVLYPELMTHTTLKDKRARE